MARYGQAFKDRVVARLLPPESAEVDAVAREIGVSVQTLERWRRRRCPGPLEGGPGRRRPARGGDHYGGDGRGGQERMVP